MLIWISRKKYEKQQNTLRNLEHQLSVQKQTNATLEALVGALTQCFKEIDDTKQKLIADNLKHDVTQAEVRNLLSIIRRAPFFMEVSEHADN